VKEFTGFAVRARLLMAPPVNVFSAQFVPTVYGSISPPGLAEVALASVKNTYVEAVPEPVLIDVNLRGFPSVLVPVEIVEFVGTINWPPLPIEYGLRVLSPVFSEYMHEFETFTIVGLEPTGKYEYSVPEGVFNCWFCTSERRPVFGSAANTVISPVPVAFGGTTPFTGVFVGSSWSRTYK
jgi:hypothetical protein